MSSQPTQSFSPQSSIPQVNPANHRGVFLCVLGLTCCALTGCQDGPLYALKAANPYYSMREWKRDEAIGVTDHERRKQLTLLSETIDQLPANKQEFWTGHLKQMMENDENPEMRRLVVRTAGRLQDPSALAIVDKGLDDASVKVRMEACHALGRMQGDEAARTLAAAVGTDTSLDVRHAAIEALASHSNQIAIDSLKVVLSDRNPATRDLAIQSLRGSTGKDYGDNPQVWIAALDGKPTPQVETRLADRIRNLF